jgi:hypothetical protein
MGATRTRTSWHGNSWAYKRIQWTSRRAGLRQPRARLGPLEFGTSDHPAGPRHHTCGPAGWQVLQVFQPVAIRGTDHPLTRSESTGQCKQPPAAGLISHRIYHDRQRIIFSMIVFIGTTRGTFRSHKTSAADLQDLRLTQNLKPCHYISFLGTLSPTHHLPR